MSTNKNAPYNPKWGDPKTWSGARKMFVVVLVVLFALFMFAGIGFAASLLNALVLGAVIAPAYILFRSISRGTAYAANWRREGAQQFVDQFKEGMELGQQQALAQYRAEQAAAQAGQAPVAPPPNRGNAAQLPPLEMD